VRACVRVWDAGLEWNGMVGGGDDRYGTVSAWMDRCMRGIR